jgi:signal transduction histidine kinase
MVASTSHDMKTPLNSIINMLALLDNQIIKTGGNRNWVKIAENSSYLLLSLVNDTLDFY